MYTDKIKPGTRITNSVYCFFKILQEETIGFTDEMSFDKDEMKSV